MHFGLYSTAVEEKKPKAKSSERDYSEPSSVFNVSCVPVSFGNDFLQNKEDILHRSVCSWMLWGYADFYLCPLCILCIWTSLYFCVFQCKRTSFLLQFYFLLKSPNSHTQCLVQSEPRWRIFQHSPTEAVSSVLIHVHMNKANVFHF